MRNADCRMRNARTWFRLSAGLLLALLVLAPGLAFAHAASPLKEDRVQAGPYNLVVNTYSLPRTAQTASLTLVPQSGSPAFSQVQAELRPAGTTNSTPRRLQVRPDPADGPGVLEVLVTANVVGPWTLHLTLDGPAGAAQAEVPVAVSGPAAIPVWAGWLLGLSPLYCGILFVVWQVRSLRRRSALATLPG